ncbi:MAG: hypothetical protein KVP17_003322 [Porospora cf. gigantea B]|uniref:uncharacterized protein n=1 Tax=Porospora cf. gigantea B TaxID=2853592 RepID=UPI0035717C3B|nr:MAG: hypothetical protein KVP17_003322 [Porospora cf. gigantea B]
MAALPPSTARRAALAQVARQRPDFPLEDFVRSYPEYLEAEARLLKAVPVELSMMDAVCRRRMSQGHEPQWLFIYKPPDVRITKVGGEHGGRRPPRPPIRGGVDPAGLGTRAPGGVRVSGLRVHSAFVPPVRLCNLRSYSSSELLHCGPVWSNEGVNTA